MHANDANTCGNSYKVDWLNNKIASKFSRESEHSAEIQSTSYMENLKLSKYQLLAIEKIRKTQKFQLQKTQRTTPKAKVSIQRTKRANIPYFPPVPVHFYGSSKPAEALPRGSKVENIIQTENSTQEEYITITFDEYLKTKTY